MSDTRSSSGNDFKAGELVPLDAGRRRTDGAGTRLFVRWLNGINVMRYRGIFVLCLIVLGISAGVTATVLFTQWHADAAAREGAQLSTELVSLQLEQLLLERRKVVSLMKEALDAAPDLAPRQREALAKSLIETTPDLSGCGVFRNRSSVQWWVSPGFAPAALKGLEKEIRGRSWWNGLFGNASVFTAGADTPNPVLVVVEPLKARANRPDAVISVFRIPGLLEAFFSRRFPQAAPAVAVKTRGRFLYRSARWQQAEFDGTMLFEERIRTTGTDPWLLQIRSWTTAAVPRSWFNALIGVVALFSVLAISVMLWAAEKLRQMATTDELTGLFNRRFFFERWESECDRARRYKRNLACIMIDLNGFKRVNDSMGHAVGDIVLQMAARELKGHLRKSDILARFGGDEFVAALPEADLQRAEFVAEKIRGLCVRIPWASGENSLVRFSAGVSQLLAEESPQETIRRADARLYESRRTVVPLAREV